VVANATVVVMFRGGSAESSDGDHEKNILHFARRSL
jgi:hypothetical protein